MLKEWSKEDNQYSDKLWEKWSEDEKAFNKEYQKFRRFIKTTEEYKTLKEEEKKFKKLALEKTRELRTYTMDHLPKEIGILKDQKKKSWKECQDFNNQVWKKHGNI